MLSILSLVIALTALLFSATQANRAPRIAANSDDLPVASTIFAEMRSAEFRHHLNNIYDYEPTSALDGGFNILGGALPRECLGSLHILRASRSADRTWHSVRGTCTEHVVDTHDAHVADARTGN